MTVLDLMAALAKFPEDLPVVIEYDGGFGKTTVKELHVEQPDTYNDHLSAVLVISTI